MSVSSLFPATIAVDRRKFLASVSAFVASGVLPRRALALAAPYTFRQGSLDLTVVSDGALVLPLSILAPDAPQDEVRKLMAMQVSGDNFTIVANLTLVKSDKDLILFDTGSGHNFQPTAGKALESLKLAGVDPAAVTRVVFTHAHPDHVWGTVADAGGLTFPNASHHVAEAEWNFWMDADLVNKLPKEMSPFVLGAQKHLGGAKEHLATFKPGDEIIPGIMALDTAGHTPGHVSFEFAGGLVLTADAIPTPPVNFLHPDWRFGFDSIPDLAITNRRKLLDRAAKEKQTLLGYHWPYPGLGHAEAKDGGYVFLPAA